MKLIKNIILFLYLFLCPLCLCTNAEQVDNTTLKQTSAISAPFAHENNLINFKVDDISSILNTLSASAITSTVQNNISSNNSDFLNTAQETLNNIISYIYSKTYLDNKRTTLLFLAYQIQPNAP